MSDILIENYVQQLNDPETYTDVHAAVIDLVMSVRTISKDQLMVYLQKAILTVLLDSTEDSTIEEELRSSIDSTVKNQYININTLHSVLHSINVKLDVFGMEIAESRDMDTSTEILYSFINKKGTGAIQLSTKYTQNDIQLVKHVVDRIFAPEHVLQSSVTDAEGNILHRITYSVPYMSMIKHLRNGPEQLDDEDMPLMTKLSFDESELFLQDLELYGWLELYNDCFTLSTRGLVELKDFLIKTYGSYPDGTISTCFGCKDILTRGCACTNSSCNVRFHKDCKNLFRKSRNTSACPNSDCDADIEDFYSF